MNEDEFLKLLKTVNLPDTQTARRYLQKVLDDEMESDAKSKVALTNAYRRGYAAGVKAKLKEKNT